MADQPAAQEARPSAEPVEPGPVDVQDDRNSEHPGDEQIEHISVEGETATGVDVDQVGVARAQPASQIEQLAQMAAAGSPPGSTRIDVGVGKAGNKLDFARRNVRGVVKGERDSRQAGRSQDAL